MSDPLSIILRRSDAREPRFAGDEVATWPYGAAERLTACGLVREVENATSVVCDACADRHVEEVVLIKSARASSPRFYIHCPENGRVLVPNDRLRQWEIDFTGLAGAVARSMDLAGKTEEVVPGRIWSLGKTTLAAQSRELFLARGLTWEDAREIHGKSTRLHAARSALVFVAGEVPPNAIWNGDAPPVVAVKTVAGINATGLTVDRIHLESLLSTGRKKVPVAPMKAFPTPAGTIWGDVRVIVTETELSITAKGKTRQYTFQEAEFEEKRRKNAPNRLWRLLSLFAMHGGVLPSRAVEVKVRTKLKQYVCELRGRFRALIPGIEDNMITHDKEEETYTTAFRISSEEALRFPTRDGATWKNVTISANGPTGIRICVAASERFATPGYADENDASTHRWEAAEREGTVERNYDLRMLKLADDQDRPNRAGQALLAVLFGKGTVKRKAEDKGMNELCGVLTKLMDVDGSPFDFTVLGEKWVARFDVGSSL